MPSDKLGGGKAGGKARSWRRLGLRNGKRPGERAEKNKRKAEGTKHPMSRLLPCRANGGLTRRR
jgi:hypothetical protein